MFEYSTFHWTEYLIICLADVSSDVWASCLLTSGSVKGKCYSPMCVSWVFLCHSCTFSFVNATLDWPHTFWTCVRVCSIQRGGWSVPWHHLTSPFCVSNLEETSGLSSVPTKETRSPGSFCELNQTDFEEGMPKPCVKKKKKKILHFRVTVNTWYQHIKIQYIRLNYESISVWSMYSWTVSCVFGLPSGRTHCPVFWLLFNPLLWEGLCKGSRYRVSCIVI